MDELETAILRTVLYADVFHFPLTRAELHHFLISESPCSPDQVALCLEQSPRLAALLVCDAQYIACRPELLGLRAERSQASERLLPSALNWGRWLARLPFVRMVALTGALAMRNAVEGDDIDFLLVTTPGRVWLTRLFAVVLVRLARLSGIQLCPNYVLADDRLEQIRKDNFIAHEVAQMIPLYGLASYQAMRAANPWVLRHLPNARDSFHAPVDSPLGPWCPVKAAAEWILSGAVGNWLERWEYARKRSRLLRLQRIDSSAQLDETQVKGHFDDHGARVLRAYAERLARYHVEPLALAGD